MGETPDSEDPEAPSSKEAAGKSAEAPPGKEAPEKPVKPRPIRKWATIVVPSIITLTLGIAIERSMDAEPEVEVLVSFAGRAPYLPGLPTEIVDRRNANDEQAVAASVRCRAEVRAAEAGCVKRSDVVTALEDGGARLPRPPPPDDEGFFWLVDPVFEAARELEKARTKELPPEPKPVPEARWLDNLREWPEGIWLLRVINRGDAAAKDVDIVIPDASLASVLDATDPDRPRAEAIEQVVKIQNMNPGDKVAIVAWSPRVPSSSDRVGGKHNLGNVDVVDRRVEEERSWFAFGFFFLLACVLLYWAGLGVTHALRDH